MYSTWPETLGETKIPSVDRGERGVIWKLCELDRGDEHLSLFLPRFYLVPSPEQRGWNGPWKSSTGPMGRGNLDTAADHLASHNAGGHGTLGTSRLVYPRSVPSL